MGSSRVCRRNRNTKIDFLRGIAILSVLILHFNLSYHLSNSALTNIFSVDFISTIASNGNYGVTIFFVISGFLITSTSLERFGTLGNIDMVGFYIFRFARIMPCLLLALSFITLFSFLKISIFENNPNSTSMFVAILSVLTFWHNYLMEKIGYFNYCLNIFWSLSVEEVFYIAFPIVCLFLKKTRYIISFLIVLMIISPIYRHLHTDNEIISLYGNLSCFDAIAMGCCTALIANKIHLTIYFKNMLHWCAWLLIIFLFFYTHIMDNIVIGISLMALATAVLIITANQQNTDSKFSSVQFSKVICWFGQYSYELYLFHIIVLALMKEIVSREALGNYTKLIWLAIFISLSALTSAVIAKLYSQPLNKSLRMLLSNVRFRSSSKMTLNPRESESS